MISRRIGQPDGRQVLPEPARKEKEANMIARIPKRVPEYTPQQFQLIMWARKTNGSFAYMPGYVVLAANGTGIAQRI